MKTPIKDDPEELADLIEEESELDWPKIKRLLPGLPTESLVNLMPGFGLFVNRMLALEINGRKDAVFSLRRFLQNGENWYDAERPFAWAPIHAIHILALNKSPEALELILEVVRFRSEELGDFLTEDVASLLHNFGPEAIGALKEFSLDETLPPFARSAALRAFCAHAAKNEAYKADAIAFMRSLLKNNRDPDFGASMVDNLLGLDKSALPEVLAAFHDGRIDPSAGPESEIKELVSGEFDDMTQFELELDTRNPLDHFSRSNLVHLRNVEKSWEKDDEGRSEQILDLVKAAPEKGTSASTGKGPSKNATCPRGSGKKYKRCCMPDAKRQ